jgi:hypothetical protein
LPIEMMQAYKKHPVLDFRKELFLVILTTIAK